MSFLYIPVSRGSNGSNTFVGISALADITTGIDNSAFGFESLNSNSTGSFNSAFGHQSLFSNNGDNNSAFGRDSLELNTTGSLNSAFGVSALRGNISGLGNSAFGVEALRFNQTGDENVAFGQGALFQNRVGSRNVAIGVSALSDAGIVAGGNLNVGVGYRSGFRITTGEKNSILGSFDGNQGGLDIRTLSNYIVLSDGDGNPRLWSDNTGAIHIPGGTVFPSGTPNAILYLDGSGVVTSSTSLEYLPSITGASTDPLVDISGTWNTSGAAGGIRLDVTDTASAAGALLMDLRVGGASRLSVNKFGSLIGSGTFSIANTGAGSLRFIVNSTQVLYIDTAQIRVPNFGIIFCTTNDILSPEFSLLRDAANTLAQRNGVNPQAFRVYNTFTDASNYERGFVRWSSNILQIGTEALGTGANRDIQFWGYGRRIMSLTDSATVAAHIVGQGATTPGAPTGTLTVSTLTNGVARVGLDVAFSDTTGSRIGGFKFSDTQTPGDWVACQMEMVQSFGAGNAIISRLAAQNASWPGTSFVSETTISAALTVSPTFQWRNATTVQLTIDQNNNIVANNAAIATTATDGFVYVAGCAGTPTGTPTAYTGRVPIVVDTTNHKLYFYSGGAWRDAGP